MKPSKSVYSSMLLHLAEEQCHRQAFELLLKMPQLPGRITPELDQIHLILETCSETADLQFMKDCVANMRRMGQRPTAMTFRILFAAYQKLAARDSSFPIFDELSLAIKEYVRQGLAFDPAIAHTLHNIYANIGDFDRAQDILALYETALAPSQDESSDSNRQSWDPARSMLRRSKSYSDIEKVAQTLGVPCSVDHYSIVINNCIRSGDVSEAFHIYAASKEDGIVPDSGLIAPLLRVIGEERSDEAIDKAMAIYQDLVNAHPSSSLPPSRQSFKTLDDHSEGPDAAIYDRLFRILLSSPNFNKCLPLTEALLEEMAGRGLPMDTNSVATVQILLEMRRLRNFSEAIDVYRERRDRLNEHGFHAILQEYCRISFVGDLEVPLITQYFSIVNDMRLRKISITSKVYTIILHSIGVMATKLKQVGSAYRISALERLVSTVRRVHDYLTLDASISPDAILWNQLMNTYQRLGCFGDTCRLWEMMYLTGRFDQISVNIMLDACGFAGHLDVAKSMLSKLARMRFALDLRNWNTWIECLCRNGKFDHAVEVVCKEMKQNGLKPTVESIRIILKFVKRDNIPLSVLRPVSESWPQLWKQLAHEIQNL
ncbi:hypothetical protein CPB84DRAFT_1760378 [Gymnopilus junonius]|uniref:Pentatricopeptide repeat-containing protein-mitochondrial domain-containing protein n=1 Tax=Gymnopilus junonius TaxID=109634 RepID=A0A9P5P3R1_GYMJU|nr:hypothetical protein CPB84DRAFT_1760378 [Gymnopilus junonius]